MKRFIAFIAIMAMALGIGITLMAQERETFTSKDGMWEYRALNILRLEEGAFTISITSYVPIDKVIADTIPEDFDWSNVKINREDTIGEELYMITKYNGPKEFDGTGIKLTVPAKIDGNRMIALGFWSVKENKNIAEVTFDDGIIYIDSYAFDGCENLTSVTLPDTVICLSDAVFINCPKLEKVKLSKKLKSIGGHAFSGSTFEEIELYEGLEYIGWRAFSDSKLTSITLPATLKTEYLFHTFWGSDELMSITFNGNVDISHNIFAKCNGLREIIIKDNGDDYKIVDGFFVKDDTILAYIGENRDNVVVPSQIDGMETVVGDRAFSGSDVKSIVLPVGIGFGNSAFSDNDKLEYVKLPEDLTGIFQYAFDKCTALKKVDMPKNIMTIGVRAFYQCTSLEEIFLPESLTSIGSEAFGGCEDNLLTMVVKEGSYAEQYAKDNGFKVAYSD